MKSSRAVRRVLCAFLVAILLTGMTAYAESYPRGTYYCNGNRVNVRSGPSSSYSSQYKLNYGDVVTVTGNKNGWVKISYFNKWNNSAETGYVYRKYVYQASTSKSTSSGSVYKTTANLRVRSEPSTTKGYVKTKLKKGTKVKVTKQSKSWVYVTYKGGSGWVSAKYLKKK